MTENCRQVGVGSATMNEARTGPPKIAGCWRQAQIFHLAEHWFFDIATGQAVDLTGEKPALVL